MPPHPHRSAHNHFAYKGPVPRCDCDLLETRFPCQPGELVHAELVERREVEQPVNEGRATACYTVEVRRCPACGIFWWSHIRSKTDVTTARDDETRVVGSVTSTHGQAVRCADRDTAEATGNWYARFVAALAHRDRLAREFSGRNPDNATLRRAVKACIDLGDITRETRLLAFDSARSVRPSDATHAAESRAMQAAVGALERDPADAAALAALKKGQSRCRASRFVDPAVRAENWTELELWSPALAPMRQLQFRIWQARSKAQGKAVGSPEHLALREIEDGIARSWTAHHASMDWPGKDVEFHFLLEHARSLQPGVVAGDTASWTHPQQVCKRLRELVEREGVAPSWRVTVPAWIAQRTGLPDGAKRSHEDACRRAYLDKWRRERARLGPATPPPRD